MFSSKSSFGNQQNQFYELGRIADIISERASIASKLSLHVCLCPPKVKSLFPPVPWKSCHQTLLAFKARFPGDSQSLCQIPRLGSLTWCLKLSQWENFFGVIVLQPVGHPLSDYGIWFYRDCAPPAISLHLLVFEHGVSFLRGFYHPPVDGGSTASCDFGALAGRDKPISFYSPILNWKLLSFKCLKCT